MLRTCLVEGREYDEASVPRRSGREQLRGNEFYSDLTDWETQWITTPKNYPDMTYGNEVPVVKRMYEKWSAMYPDYVPVQSK